MTDSTTKKNPIDVGKASAFIRGPYSTPIAVLIATAIVGGFLLRLLAPLVMVSLPTEEKLVDAVMAAAGEGNEVKAEKVLEKLSGSLGTAGYMCIATTDEQVFESEWNGSNLYVPDEEKVKATLETPKELKRGTAPLKVHVNLTHNGNNPGHLEVSLHRGKWTSMLHKRRNEPLDDKTFEVADWTNAPTEGAWELHIYDAVAEQGTAVLSGWSLKIPTEPRGPKNSDCVEFLNGSDGTAYPVTAQNILIALHDIEINGSDFSTDALAYEREDDDDLAGWTHFVGGSSLKPFSRERFGTYSDMEAGPLGPVSLFSAANVLVQLQKTEGKVAKDFGDTVRDYVINRFGNFMGLFLKFAVFFITIAIARKVIQTSTGWRKPIAAMLSLCLVVAFFTTQLPEETSALSSLSLDASKGLYEKAAGLESIAGLPFVIAGQVLDFFVATVQLIYQPATIWLLVLLGLVYTLLSSAKVERTIGAAYVFVLAGQYWQNGDYKFVPFNLDGLDASFLLAPLVWLVGLIAVFSAAVLARALWSTYGDRVIASAAATLVDSTSGAHAPAD
jgi:subtilisin-like proprotein convertase family protein